MLYEFYDRLERKAAEEERQKTEEVDLEVAKDKENLDWAEMEEKKELEQIKAKAAAVKTPDPTKDPDNIKWMEEQIRLAKKVYGDSFGEDIKMDFEEPQS